VDEAIREKKKYTIDHRVVLPDNTMRFVNEQGEVDLDAEGRVVRMVEPYLISRL